MGSPSVNEPMRPWLARARALAVTDLDPSLRGVVDAGVVAGPEGTVVLAALATSVPGLTCSVGDRVGYEAFINKLRISHSASDAVATGSLEIKLAHAVLFAEAVLALTSNITVIISVDLPGDDVVFRFHGVRTGETPWVSSIESFREPVLVMD